MHHGGRERESPIKILRIVKLKVYLVEFEMEILKVKDGISVNQ